MGINIDAALVKKGIPIIIGRRKAKGRRYFMPGVLECTFKFCFLCKCNE
jgi:hypothetical protein